MAQTAHRGRVMPVALLALLSACTPTDVLGKGAAHPPASRPVISVVQARRIFERYDREDAAADRALDEESVRMLQTGALLRQSLAGYHIHHLKKDKLEITRFKNPHFLIPAVENPKTYPRYFLAISKWVEVKKNRASVVHYFVQSKTGAPWKATAEMWALTDPLTGAARNGSPSPLPSLPAPSPEATRIELRPKQLPEPRRDASGAVQLSPEAAADRATCGHFADYLSFAPPHGHPVDPRFTEGPFSSGLVRYFNGWTDDTLQRRFIYRTTGDPLPVLRLANGSDLVACTFTREQQIKGNSASDTIRFDKDSDIGALLDDEGGNWRRVDEVSSMTALIEVPVEHPSPATVLSCDCYDPQLLSATGVPAD